MFTKLFKQTGSAPQNAEPLPPTYDETHAKPYQSYFDLGGRHQLENRVADLHPFLARPGLSEKTCLDIGCAEGEILNFLKGHFKEATGLEKSPYLFEHLQQRYGNTEGVSIIHDDFLAHPFTQTYDYVFFLGVIHCYKDMDDRVKVMDKVMDLSNELVFFRTGFSECELWRTEGAKKGKPGDEARRKNWFTSLAFVSQVAAKHNARWLFIDNTYRGVGDNQLGDLVVFQKNWQTSDYQIV